MSNNIYLFLRFFLNLLHFIIVRRSRIQYKDASHRNYVQFVIVIVQIVIEPTVQIKRISNRIATEQINKMKYLGH